MVTWDYKCPVRSPSKDLESYLSSLNGAYKMDFRQGESPETHSLGGTEIPNESEPSIPLGAIPLQFVYSEVFTASPQSLHTSCCCSFRQLVTCLLSKYYLLPTRSQGDSIKKSEKQPHCSQSSKEFLLRYSLSCVLLSCM